MNPKLYTSAILGTRQPFRQEKLFKYYNLVIQECNITIPRIFER